MATPNAHFQSILSGPQPRLPNREARKSLQIPQKGSQTPVETPADDRYDQLKAWVEEGRDRSQKWREEAEGDYDLVAGWQWDSQDMQVLADDNRPTVTFNRTGRNIDLISGMEQQGREDLAFLPREEGDVGVSEVLTATVNYVVDETDANEEKSDSFRDLVTCGMGWTNTVMNYRDWDDGLPEESRINPLEMYWDTHAQKRNLKDSRWRARARTGPTLEWSKMFAGVDPAMLNASWLGISDDPSQPSEPDRQSYNYEDSPTIGRPPLLERSTIVEVQWWEVAKKRLVEDMFTGQRVEMDEKRFNVINKGFPGRYNSAPLERKEFYRGFLGGRMLSMQKLEGMKDFTFQCMTGKRDRRTGWIGMVRAMRDPQRWANKWLSQSMHILNTGAKNTVMFEEGAVVDGRKAQENWTKPGAWVELARGAIANNRVKVQPPTSLPPDLNNMMQFALQSIQDCVGVNQEQLGMTGGTDANRAALLESERRKAGLTLMSLFFDAKRLFVKRQGRVMLTYIMKYMNDGRLIRIVNEGTKKYARLLLQGKEKDLDYDIIVDQSPDAPNQKEKTWSTIVGMLPIVGSMMTPGIWKKTLRYSPLPVSLVDGLEKEIDKAEQQQQDKPDPEEQKIPAEIAKLEAEAQRAQAQVEEIKAKIQEMMTRAQLNMAKTKETGQRVEMDALEGVRETVAMDDAREAGKLTVHENA